MEPPDRTRAADRAVKTAVTTSPLNAAPPSATATPAVHPLAAVATPTAPDRAPEQNAAGARRFAELLRARRSEAAAAPAAAVPRSAAAAADVAPKADTTAACDEPEPAAEPSASASSHPTVASRPSTPTAKHATAKANVDTASEHTDSDVDAAHDEPGSPASAAPVPPADRPPTLALVAPRPEARDAGSARDDGNDRGARATPDDAIATDATLTGDGRSAAWSEAFGARSKAAVDAAGERILAPANDHAPPNADATFASALGDVLRAVEPSPSRSVRAGEPAAPIVAGAPGEVRDLAAPATPVALATPTDSPDFAAALGVQVSVLARDGVQHAELHLHPVETGPVSIRIEVDGTTARIDFGADLAATRHAIEQGLPELASALRDAGLTLAGGGVSQHAGSRPRGDGDGADGPRPQTPAATTSPTVTPVRAAQRRIAAGGVDLYA